MAKAGKPKFKLNRAGFREILAMQADATAAAGEQVADAVRAQVPADVRVDVEHKTDPEGRPVALVTIAHPSGLARQAKDGVLTRAAAAAGLDVKRYGG